MLRSPLSWVGGKHRLRETIIKLIPPHKTYVEVFAGAAWVFFGKPAEISKSEVLNDLDGELINFWRVLKHRPAEFSEAASWLLASRELWERWAKFPKCQDEIERAVRFYSVIKLGFGAQRNPTSFGVKNIGRPSIWWSEVRDDSREIVRRLRVAWIERLDWRVCLEKYDSPETFFYLDPPYRCGGSKAYAHSFTDADHAALADRLRSTNGKWLLSYNSDPFILSLYRAKGITIGHVAVPYSISRTGRQRGRELLIRNYDVAQIVAQAGPGARDVRPRRDAAR